MADGSEVRSEAGVERLFEPGRAGGLFPHELYFRATSDLAELPIAPPGAGG